MAQFIWILKSNSISDVDISNLIMPRTLIHQGILNEKVMRRELLTRHELAGALRAAGCSGIEKVRTATLENNGQITVSLMDPS